MRTMRLTKYEIATKLACRGCGGHGGTYGGAGDRHDVGPGDVSGCEACGGTGQRPCEACEEPATAWHEASGLAFCAEHHQEAVALEAEEEAA